MKIAQLPECHLTYCTNIHPGETWKEVRNQFQHYLPAVKKAVSPDQDFGVGARLSAQAVSELLQDNHLSEFKDWLTAAGLYVFTLNGFPYGQFHHKKIKETVYQPDWSEPARLEYTRQLATVLAELLPDDCHGTISTVPVGLKSRFSCENTLEQAVDNLLEMVAFLVRLRNKTGKLVQLALEPEPGCCLDTGDSIMDFFCNVLFTEKSLSCLEKKLPVGSPASLSLLQQYLGICLDTCHIAVMFEKPGDLAVRLRNKKIGIHKIQLTAALAIADTTPDSISFLQQLSDPVYLHQCCIDDGHGRRRFYLDLPDALETVMPGEDIRVHYHVPVFSEKCNLLQTTQKELIFFLQYLSENPFCGHLEIETYTFEILPQRCRNDSVVVSIVSEIQWVLGVLDASSTVGG